MKATVLTVLVVATLSAAGCARGLHDSARLNSCRDAHAADPVLQARCEAEQAKASLEFDDSPKDPEQSALNDQECIAALLRQPGCEDGSCLDLTKPVTCPSDIAAG